MNDRDVQEIYVALLRWNQSARPNQLAEGLVLVPAADSTVEGGGIPTRFQRIGYFARQQNDPGLSWLDSIPIARLEVV